MVIQDSNKSNSITVVHHQMILHYSTNKHQIIHPFKIETYWFLNLLKWVFLVKWSIYGNDYLRFYNNIGQKGNLVDMNFYANIERSIIFSEAVIYIISPISWHFYLFSTTLIMICWKFMKMNATSGSVTFNEIFSIVIGKAY